MSKAIQQQEVSVLSSAKQGLIFLTPNDWALIADKATRLQFKSGEPIVQLGKRSHGIHLIVRGSATAHIPSLPTAAVIGPGEVCGEVSFLLDVPASADVITQEETEVYYLDRPTLQSLFELFPHLGSRFYRSLASGLARRLRDVISVKAPNE
jgi:CRP-like cAMP-binding protein